MITQVAFSTRVLLKSSSDRMFEKWVEQLDSQKKGVRRNMAHLVHPIRSHISFPEYAFDGGFYSQFRD